VGDAGARLRGLLVSSQVALALVLLVGAGLLARSFDNLRSVELGFEPAGVTTFQLFLGGAYETPERVAFARELEERLASLPNVDAVGLTGTLPLSGSDGDASFHVEGRPLPEPGREPAAWIRRVTPGYLPAMEIEVLRGRGFGDADVEGDREVVIVNETLAARWFPGEDPVGRRITFSDPAADDPFWREIVGVARDIRNFGIRAESRMAVYLPWAQAPGFAINGVVRSDVPGEELVPALRTHVAELDPDLAVARIQPMTALVERALAPERFLTLLLSLFAAVGVTLAAVGLYGLVSWSVGRRVRELGLRMALGAGTARIAGMVMRRSLGLVGAGVVAGIGAVLLLTGLLDGLLFGVEATDPATLAAVVLLLVGVAAVAAAVPALRAAAVDPSRALRGE
jgi:putative ABC transport system permease protein